MSISCCIIVKNEEEYITDCINSVIDFVDEIIINDTGSTDNTISICNSFNKVKLFETQWNYNNAISRNYCIDKAKSKYILFLDADERLDYNTSRNLKNFIIKNIHKYPLNSTFAFRSINQNPFNFEKMYFKASLFRNDGKIKYERLIHDYPTHLSGSLNYVECPNMIINHLNGMTYEELQIKNKSYIERIEYILKNNLESDHNHYYLYHLANSYFFLKEYDKSLDIYFQVEKIAVIKNKIDLLKMTYQKIDQLISESGINIGQRSFS